MRRTPPSAPQIVLDENPLAAWKVPGHAMPPQPTAEQTMASEHLRVAHHLFLTPEGHMLAGNVPGYLRNPNLVIEQMSAIGGGGPVIPVDREFSCAGVPLQLLAAPGDEATFNLTASMLANECATERLPILLLHGTVFITSAPDATGVRVKLPVVAKKKLKQVALGFWEVYENRRPANPAAVAEFDLRRSLLAELLEAHRDPLSVR